LQPPAHGDQWFFSQDLQKEVENAYSMKSADIALSKTTKHLGKHTSFLPLFRRRLLWISVENSTSHNVTSKHRQLELAKTRSPLSSFQIRTSIKKQPMAPHDHIARYLTRPEHVLLTINGAKVTISGLIRKISISQNGSNVNLAIQKNLFQNTNPIAFLQNLNGENFNKKICGSWKPAQYQLGNVMHYRKEPKIVSIPTFSMFTPYERMLINELALHPKVLTFLLSFLQKQTNRNDNILLRLLQFSPAENNSHFFVFPQRIHNSATTNQLLLT